MDLKGLNNATNNLNNIYMPIEAYLAYLVDLVGQAYLVIVIIVH